MLRSRTGAYFQERYKIALKPVEGVKRPRYLELMINGQKAADVELISAPTGQNLMTLMEQDNLDMAIVGITPAIGSISLGCEARIIQPVQNLGSGLVLANASGAEDWDDFVSLAKASFANRPASEDRRSGFGDHYRRDISGCTESIRPAGRESIRNLKIIRKLLLPISVILIWQALALYVNNPFVLPTLERGPLCPSQADGRHPGQRLSPGKCQVESCQSDTWISHCRLSGGAFRRSHRPLGGVSKMSRRA